MRSFLVLALFFAIALPQLSFAENSCSVVFKFKSWSELPDANVRRWSPEYESLLQNHPITKSLREKYGTGESLQFAVQYADRAQINGWTLQADFVKNVLIKIFPDARFKSAERNCDGCVVFRLDDQTLLTSNFHNQTRNGILDMTLLKAANPGPAPVSKAVLRKQMSLPAEAKIASLYVSRMTPTKTVEDTLYKLFESSDIVILSEQYLETNKNFKSGSMFVRKLEGIGVTFVESSQWTSRERNPSKKYLILNETRGKMPFMHGTADVSAVLGFANLFEPLNFGNPVYIVHDANINKNDGFSGWDHITTVAKKSGAAFEVSLENLTETIARTSNIKPAPTYSIELMDGKNALDLLLGQIEIATSAK